MKNQDQVLIDGLLENHVGLAFLFWGRGEPWEILPWLSFNLLISRLSTSLCMVSGRCCISLKMKSWREDSYCVWKKKKKYIYWSYFLGMDIFFFRGLKLKLDPPTEAPSLSLQPRGGLRSAGFNERWWPLTAQSARQRDVARVGPAASVVGLTLESLRKNIRCGTQVQKETCSL